MNPNQFKGIAKILLCGCLSVMLLLNVSCSKSSKECNPVLLLKGEYNLDPLSVLHQGLLYTIDTVRGAVFCLNGDSTWHEIAIDSTCGKPHTLASTDSLLIVSGSEGIAIMRMGADIQNVGTIMPPTFHTTFNHILAVGNLLLIASEGDNSIWVADLKDYSGGDEHRIYHYCSIPKPTYLAYTDSALYVAAKPCDSLSHFQTMLYVIDSLAAPSPQKARTINRAEVRIAANDAMKQLLVTDPIFSFVGMIALNELSIMDTIDISLLSFEVTLPPNAMERAQLLYLTEEREE